MNSTALNGESNSSTNPLILNTSQCNSKSFNEFVAFTDEIERLRCANQPRLSYNSAIKAKLTRTEIYESSALNDDEFLSALEHQTSYDAVAANEPLDLSRSLEKTLSYLEEDILISSESNRSTPTNLNFKRHTEMANAADINQPQAKRKPMPPTSHINELCAKFEQHTQLQPVKVTKTPAKINTPPLLKAPALIKAVKLKSAAQLSAALRPRSPATAPPKITKKSKVKQIAQMFNKMSQFLHVTTAEVTNYAPLNNEYSPDPKQLQAKTPTSAPPVPKPRKKPTAIQSPPPLPLPLPRNKLPVFRTGGGVRSPVYSPRLRRRNSQKTATNTCLIAEDAFSQLSVRDKVLLYTKFIDDMSQKSPKFEQHAEQLEANVKQQLARGEVVNEKQESVKHLTEELEAKCEFPRLFVSPKAVERMQSVNDATFMAKHTADAQLQVSMHDSAEQLYHAECVQVIEEDEVVEDPLHVSTLTVILKPSPNGKRNSLPSSAERPKAMSRQKRNQRLLHHLSLIEPSQKRSNDSIRSAHLSTDPYAPPKKIRRTRSERLNPQHFFQNVDLEKLFFSWFKERNGVDFDITHSDNETKRVMIVNTTQQAPDKSINNSTNPSEITQKSAVERLLEEAIAKLENTHISKEKTGDDVLENAETAIKRAPPPTPLLNKPKRKPKAPAPPPPTTSEQLNCDSGVSTLKKKAPAPPQQVPLISSTGSSALSSAKHSDIESESGVSTLPKSYTDDSQAEQRALHALQTQSKDFEFVKPQKPPRRKKMRRTLSWKNENYIIESKLAEIITTTTDSDSDYKVKVNKKYPTTPAPSKFKQRGNHIKKLCFKTLKAVPLLRHATTPKKSKSASSKDNSPKGLNKKFLRVMNSPRRVKTAYTLTVLSSPSPYTESDQGEYSQKELSPQPTPTKLEASLSWPTMLPPKALSEEGRHSTADMQNTKMLQNELQTQRPLSDSFIDQGFETATNSLESPIRLKRHQRAVLTELVSAPLITQPNLQQRNTLPRSASLALGTLHKQQSKETPSNYSTPVKGHVQKSFISPAMVQQQYFSPIPTPLKPRRSETRRSSIAMQVIREGHAFDAKQQQQPLPPAPFTPDRFSASENAFFANAPTLDMSGIDLELTNQTKIHHSSFWIMIDGFTVSIKINYCSPDRVRLFYHIFSQKFNDFKDIHFGIDSAKFSFYNPNGSPSTKREPPPKDCSSYWFSTADIATPFSGNFMSPSHVQRLFKFLRKCINEKSVIHFGVDNFEFTCPRERISEATGKLSMESSYSMLIGLQSGHSNGLEGRSRFAWPNSLCNVLNANNVQISDLDNSELDTSSWTSSDMRRNSNSPFSANSTLSLSLQSTPRSSAADTASPEFFEYRTGNAEQDPMAEIFKDAQQYNLSKSQTDKMPRPQSLTVPELLETLTQQQEKLKSVEQRINTMANQTTLTQDAFEQFKESPEYIRKLRNIIKIIDNIGRDKGFKACTVQQLESFLFFLSRYADLCLSKCSDHIDTILNALNERRPQTSL